MAFCGTCGWALDAGATVCPKCGTSVATEPVPAEAQGVAPSAPAPAPATGITIGELLGEPLKRVFDEFSTYFSTQGVVFLVSSLLGVAASIVAMLYAPALAGAMASGSVSIPALVGASLPIMAVGAMLALVTFLLNAVGSAMGVLASEGLDADERRTFEGAWAILRPRLGNLLVTNLLMGLGFALCFLPAILFLIVGSDPSGGGELASLGAASVLVLVGIAAFVVLALLWSVATPVALFESREPADNLKRSLQLTKGHRIPFLGILVLVFAAGTVYGLVVSALMFALPAPMGPVLSQGLTVAFSLVSALYMASATQRYYRRVLALQPASSAPSADAMRST